MTQAWIMMKHDVRDYTVTLSHRTNLRCYSIVE